jgi:hypothetical protein
MTASAINKLTPTMGLAPMPEFDDLPVAASEHILAGTMVAADASGDLVMLTAANSSSVKVLGRAEQEKDNSSGIAGALSCRVRYGIFHYANKAGDELADSDRFSLCYAADNQTVSATDGGATRGIAGVVIDVDSTGVWVLQGPMASALGGLSVTAGAVQKISKSIVEADLSGTTAQTIDFASALPTGAMLLAIQVHLVANFTGGGVSTLALDVGKSGAIEAYIKDLDILGSGAGYYSKSGTPTAPAPVSASGVTIRCTITPDGGTNMTALTAGSLTVTAYYAV